MDEQEDRQNPVDLITESGLFDEKWYTATYPDVAYTQLPPIEHYLRIGARLGREPNADFDSPAYLRENPEVDSERGNPLVHFILADTEATEAQDTPNVGLKPGTGAEQNMPEATSPALFFDEVYYLLHNSDVANTGMSGEDHFYRYGYLEMRNPRPDFDLWWYTQNYLLGTDDEDSNPFVHYNEIGAEKGYLPTPPVPVVFDKSQSRTLTKQPRRICLFAAYDRDGLIDDYVLDYLRDMARHADIYYLADCPMDAEEMAKLDGLVKGAWAERHGAYDFGSYSRLARDLVGWDVIEQYDEMILANDSCFLVHPLEQTFQEMAKRPCAWWGLQATKGLISTMHQNKIPVDAPLTLDDVKETHLTKFEDDVIYDFHIGSYFLVFRQDVIRDPGFRRVLDNVREEESKLSIIRKYEIGISRFLIGRGYEFDTLVDTVTKEHPLFSERAFDLIDAGFPLLKRYFLSDNHYRIPGLVRWKSRVLAANPKADVASFEKNLYRAGDALKLYNGFRIGQNSALSKLPRGAAQMKAQDLTVPKYDHWWAFPVCAYSHLFSDNTRAVFERVKNDPNIKKIILTRSIHIEVEGVNTVVLPLHSHEGQTYLLRARQVFLRHGVRSNTGYPLSGDLHNFYNLWHGIPLKRIGYTSLDQASKLKDVAAENKRLKSVIAASDVDRLAMTAAYWPLTYHDVWVTGLPRHDFILASESDLPKDFIQRGETLQARLKGRKFLLFAPTFRADQEDGYYNFSDEEVQQLADWLTRNGIVMGIREHMADKAGLYSSQLRGDCFIDVSGRLYPDIELLYRHADILLTDYSSTFIDFMLTGRPVISFAFDKENYSDTERGLFYDQELVFPGPICPNFVTLMEGLEKSLQPTTEAEQQAYDWKVDFFHKYRDTHNSDRVIEKVKDDFEGSKTLWQGDRLDTALASRTVTFIFSRQHQITNRYRVFNLMEHLNALGWSCRAVEEHHLTLENLQQSGVMIICRLPMSDALLDICETYRLQGGKIIYDLDDLIHDMKAFSQSEYFRRRPERSSDSAVLSEVTRRMAATADAITATTESLAETLQKFGKPVTIVPNSISTALIEKFSSLPAARPGSDKIRICYLSGTATHWDDFAQCRSALSAVLQRHPNAELHIIGKIGVDETDDSLQDVSAIRHDLMTYEAMHDFLTGMDINLAPLAPSLFNDCKSELKIFDAALHGVVSIASPTRSYRGAIDDGQNGLIATSPQDWENALEQLITDADQRQRLGVAAFEQIVPEFTAARAGKILAGVLYELTRDNPQQLSLTHTQL